MAANTRKILRVSEGLITEQITLTALDIVNKSTEVSGTVTDPSQTVLLPVCGVPQHRGNDYTTIGNMVSWLDKGLETILEENDTIIVIYKGELNV